MKRLLLILLLLSALPAYAQGVDPTDTPLKDITVPFAKGQWLPDQLSINVGIYNFTKFENWYYTESGVKGVPGYSKINTAALSTYTNIDSGCQLTTDYDVGSYVLVHAKDSSGNGAVFQNRADIPDQGNFSATAIHTDSSGAGMGRFSSAPDGNIVYCNGVDNYIWGGNETYAEGFYACDDASGTNPKDYSGAVKNTLATSGNMARISTTQKYWMVFSTRPLQAVKYVVEGNNTSPSTTSGKYWNGTNFAATTNWVDGTASGGISLSKNGTMSFASTVGVAKPYHFEGTYTYAYLFQLTAASNIDISHVTVDMPWQSILDIWDRVPRECKQFQAYRTATGAYSEYTHEINEESTVYYPIAGTIGNLTSSDHVLLMFKDRTAAIKWTMVGDKTNLTAATATVQYWAGRGWVSVSDFTDGTLSGGKSLNQSGLMSWMPPTEGSEFPKTEFGETGYFYKISWSATLTNGADKDGSGTSVDFVTGVPAQKLLSKFKFSIMYKNRLLLCNDELGKEQNAISYSLPSSPDVWNGDLTSNDGMNTLKFGGEEALTCATPIYNRYGADVTELLMVFKKDKTYMLEGDSPENFKISSISSVVGCPAPLTLASAETGFEMATNIRRNIGIFMSYSGAWSFDGAVLLPLLGIENYFDPQKNECINYSAIEKSRGWYDSTTHKYNLVIPTGTSTINNMWLYYDVIYKKWGRKNPGSASVPQCALDVIDDDGIRYSYGGTKEGYLMRLDYGTSWDGIPIDKIIKTGAFFLTDNPWEESLIRFIRVMGSAISENSPLVVTHIKNTESTGVYTNFVDSTGCSFIDSTGCTWMAGDNGITLTSLDLTASGADLVDEVKAVNLQAKYHELRFKISTSKTDSVELPGFGIRGRKVRTVGP